VNQHGERVYLWTDDRLEVPVRWYIENVRYYLTGIHEVSVPDSMFDLPPGYTKTDRFNPTKMVPYTRDPITVAPTRSQRLGTLRRQF
jgi:hypothetical protein